MSTAEIACLALAGDLLFILVAMALDNESRVEHGDE